MSSRGRTKTGVPVVQLENPRSEAPENELSAENRLLLDLGLQPTKLETGLLEEVMDVARRYANRCDLRKIPSTSKWVRRPLAPTGEAPAA